MAERMMAKMGYDPSAGLGASKQGYILLTVFRSTTLSVNNIQKNV